MQTDFLNDAFEIKTGETSPFTITGHSGELSGPWRLYQVGSGNSGRFDLRGTSPNGYARNNGASNTNAIAWNESVPPSPDYTVALGIDQRTTGTDQGGPLGRFSSGPGNYVFTRRSTAGKLEIIEVKGGSGTVLATSTQTWTPQVGVDVAYIKFTGTTVSAWVNDGTVNAVGTTTITAAGFAGFGGFMGQIGADSTNNQYRGIRAYAELVGISPANPSLLAGDTQQFSATSPVSWSIQEGVGGGTITADGLYTAPAGAGTFHVVGTPTDGVTAPFTTTVTVSALIVPGSSTISIATQSGKDAITTGAASLGTYALSGYGLYVGAGPGLEGPIPVATISAPGTFPLQDTAAVGTFKYYVVKPIDVKNNLGLASNEVSSSGGPPAGYSPVAGSFPHVFVANYGAAGAGLNLGYTIYSTSGAVLVPHTTAGVTEPTPGRYLAAVQRQGSWTGLLVWDKPAGAAEEISETIQQAFYPSPDKIAIGTKYGLNREFTGTATSTGYPLPPASVVKAGYVMANGTEGAYLVTFPTAAQIVEGGVATDGTIKIEGAYKVTPENKVLEDTTFGPGGFIRGTAPVNPPGASTEEIVAAILGAELEPGLTWRDAILGADAVLCGPEDEDGFFNRAKTVKRISSPDDRETVEYA